MAISIRSVRNGVIILILLSIPVLLLRVSTRNPHHLSAFDRSVRRIGAPMQAAVSYSAGMLGSFFERWVLQARMQDQNAELASENREMRYRLRRLVELEDENDQLRRALQMRERVEETLLPAERVGVDQSPFFRVVNLRIDRGTHSVHPGMAVVSPDGVVGRIDKTFDAYSDVMLITDARSRVAVELARSGAQGILRGEDEDGCVVDVSKDYTVEPGELVQTSGVDEMFPQGHPIGQVVRVEHLVGDQQRLHVMPAVRFDRVDVVWVVAANRLAATGQNPQPSTTQTGATQPAP